jgi:tRNA A-37 threonylcarbamoyl transferase component Bud32
MAINIKKFCKNNNFKFLDNLTYDEKNEVKSLLNTIYSKKKVVKNVNTLELLNTYFFKERENRDVKWIVKSTIGKPGKDGSGYIVYEKDNPMIEYVMKEFKSKKSFDKVRNEILFQSIASLYGISPKIYEYGRKPNPYIIMEKMKDGTIIDVIKSQSGKLSLDQQRQLLNIYDTLNKIQINHNDFNLLNLMFNNGKLYIIDYGFSKPLKGREDNFSSLELALITLRGYHRFLKEAPMLLLPYIKNEIQRNYWIEKTKK